MYVSISYTSSRYNPKNNLKKLFITLVKNGKADDSRRAAIMEFCGRGVRLGSTLSTKEKVRIYSQSRVGIGGQKITKRKHRG